MNKAAYAAATMNANGCVLRSLDMSFLRVTGPDRVQFLQGQISNNVSVPTNHWLDACLLNNTGHLVAVLTAYVLDDEIIVGTDAVRADVLRRTLERYIVRERVEIQPTSLRQITVQGPAWVKANADAFKEGKITDQQSLWVCHDNESWAVYTSRRRFTAPAGADCILPHSNLSDTLTAKDCEILDDDTARVLRVEAGEPAWGAELDETVIPLEAGLENAISYTKGCYMGQEIIARIHSRGHTNRSMVGLALEAPADAGAVITAMDGDRAGQEIGRVTSAALSPRYGNIALGYVRNQYAVPGSNLLTATGRATVVPLPFRSAAGPESGA